MVSKGQIGIGAVIVMCVVAAGVALYPTTDTMPGAEVVFDVNNSMIAKSMTELTLDIGISYHDFKIYELTEFKVEVRDSLSSDPIEGANVSFMIPGIFGHTNKEGYVFFSAPFISEYTAEANDTEMAFPLIVKKEGYKTVNKTIVVHIRKKSGIE